MIFSNEHNKINNIPNGGLSSARPGFIKSAPIIQEKLEIGESDDKYEVEADRMADQVTQMKLTAVEKPIPSTGRIQRKCNNCEEDEERIRKKPLSEQITPIIQCKSSSLLSDHTTTNDITSKIYKSKGGGKALDKQTKDVMESGFDTNFSNVRIHTDSNAINLSKKLNAQAFTVGNDIYFNEGKYNPNSHSGKHLLAHELTHTIQQDAGDKTRIQKYDLEYEQIDELPLQSRLLNTPYFQRILSEPGRVVTNFTNNSNIGRLQQALVILNYILDEFGVDSKFGGETERALRNFQIERGIGSDSHGRLDATTLRAVDSALTTQSYSRRSASYSGEGQLYLVFRIPIDRIVDRRTYFTNSVMHMLNVSEREADILRTEHNWHLTNYTPLTDLDVERGFRNMRIRNDLYQSIHGEYFDRRYNSRDESQNSAIEGVQDSIFDLYGTDSIYELNKRISELENTIMLLSLGHDPRVRGEDLRIELRAEKSRLIAERNRLLQERGISLSIYRQSETEFKNSFGRYAQTVAVRMLRSNEVSANIESQRYQNSESLLSLSRIVKQLAAHYSLAARERSAGIVEEMPYHVTGVEMGGGSLGNPRAAAERVYEHYKFGTGRRGGNDHFINAYDANQRAFDLTEAHAPNFSILAHPDFHKALKRHASSYESLEPEELGARLLPHISSITTDIKNNIDQIVGSIDSNNIWELDVVIAQTKLELGIQDGTIHDTLINDAVQDHRDSEFARDIWLAALGIGLGLLALASGPVGWVALAGSVTVNVIDAVIQYQEASFTSAAHRTAIDPSNSLTNVDASWWGFGLSLLGLGLDVFDAFKLIRAIGRTGEALTEVTEIQTAAVRVINELEQSTDEALRLADPQAARALVQTEEFAESLVMLNRLNQTGLLARISQNILDNPNLIRALIRLQDENLTTVIDFYTGVGAQWLNQLPEVLHVIDAGQIATRNPQLYQSILTDPRIQKVLLDHYEDPETLLRAWDTWQAARRRPRDPVSSNFLQYLSRGLNFSTRIDGGVRSSQTLINRFGRSFLQLNNFQKNLLLLRESAPRLVAAFQANTLAQRFPDIHRMLDELLNEDIIRNVSVLSNARGRVVSRVNRLVGEQITDVNDFKYITDLLDQSGSIGSVGEHFARAQNLLQAQTRVIQPRIAVEGVEGFNARKFIIPDQIRIPPPRTLDIKTGYEGTNIDPQQLQYYGELITRSNRGQQDVVNALETVQPGLSRIDGHDYLFLPRGANGDALIAARRAFDVISGTDYSQFFKVFYLDVDNVVKEFTGI
ncbi:DUF4157 domain-containing protein [uncultured Psychroserpens sp.]|uniref:eCIS core domain-containing protein n=1 Tax=uncultured Psychroserpens sp. TaxID=255436 RepID=UPI0026340146|nr:DUF4157 domain-containing protein [uncultured Psychroserpens sp.]